MWKAAFVEDAQDLHLATKKMFSVAVWFMLEEPEVYDNFVKYTVNGEERLRQLVNDLKDAIGESNLRAMDTSEETTSWREAARPESSTRHDVDRFVVRRV